MALENYSNSPIWNLAGDIDDSVTTITLNGVTGLPDTTGDGQFRLYVDTELMIVTAISGMDLTVIRGQEGTTATDHASGTIAVHIVTKEGLESLVRQSLNGTNVCARRELDFVDDNGVTWSVDDDPTNNKSIIKAAVAASSSNFEAAKVPTAFSDWTWVNQGIATGGDTTPSGGVSLRASNSGSSGEQVRALVRNAPSAPYTATFRLNYFAFSSGHAGVMFRSSSTSRISGLAISYFSGSISVNVHNWTSPTVFSASIVTSGMNVLTQGALWFRLEDDNTNRKYYLSQDGIEFIQIGSTGRTTFLTADQVGIFVGPSSVGSTVHVLLSSFSF